MRFFQMVASSAAFIAAALALEINTYPTTGVVAGQTYQVTYSPADNTPTTFILRKGVSTNLDTLATITCTFDPQQLSRKKLVLTNTQPLLLAVLSPGLSPRTSPMAPTTLLRSAVVTR
jgi:hypothetical protein